ncbi:DNA mismatch repair ATPase msh1 [Arachnomyces sp. PD_36]|nr:DNA mismatch repair ATPase msh1 [Arachnomyces sp. PD_36]
MRPYVRYGQRLTPSSISHRFTVTSALCYSNGPRTVYTVASRRVTAQKNPLSSSSSHCRGAKTKSTVKLKDLPQGGLKPEEPFEPDVNDAPQYPTVIQGVKNNMSKFKNCVLLTRLYFEQAEEYAPLLSLKLASKKTNAGPVPMAGFPYFQLDRFLKLLVHDLNKYVAISEEFSNGSGGDGKSGGLMFDRRVARIITPGTLIDEKFMDPYENNFLLSIYMDVDLLGKKPVSGEDAQSQQHMAFSGSQRVGLSWLDLSTGDFFTQATTADMLPSAVARIGAREIVVDEKLRDTIGQDLQALVGRDPLLLTFFGCPKDIEPMSQWGTVLESPITPEVESTFTSEETCAGFGLLEYVRVQLQGLEMKLQPPRRKHLDESMGIDRSSLRGLEILETARDGLGKGSLLHAVRRTCTKGGARLLRDRLTSPSVSLHVINERLDLVSQFIEDEESRENVVTLLQRSYDVQRLVQKFSLGRGDADDLICLSRAIEASREIKTVLMRKGHEIGESAPGSSAESSHSHHSGGSLYSISNRLHLDGPIALSQRISRAIDEDGLLKQQRADDSSAANSAALAQEVVLNEGLPEDLEAMPKKIRTKAGSKASTTNDIDQGDEDTWIMRRDASHRLRKLHDNLEHLIVEKSTMTQELRAATETTTLNLKWTPGLGHIVHLKGSKGSQKALEDIGVTKTVSSSKSTRSFYLPSWSRLGARIDQAKLHIRAEEKLIFEDLRQNVIRNLVKLRRNAAVLDELDVACSFAILAQEQQLVRPVLNTSTCHKIVGGRHPTVKLGLEEQGRPFVSNDCFIGGEERIWLITGPNMAGKSTFLRQNALITILAQAGSFVPAAHAEIGIVDQIFSRIGAADDLFRDQSTFMVEMLETAAILKQASSRSFVIMDEVGRGTTPEDGTAVSFACLHHLYNINRCRTLFATHFHALADMTQDFENLGRYCTDVREDPSSGSFSFVHRLKKGVNRQSHALKVARLAGLPESAIDIAKDVLRNQKADTGLPQHPEGSQTNDESLSFSTPTQPQACKA